MASGSEVRTWHKCARLAFQLYCKLGHLSWLMRSPFGILQYACIYIFDMPYKRQARPGQFRTLAYQLHLPIDIYVCVCVCIGVYMYIITHTTRTVARWHAWACPETEPCAWPGRCIPYSHHPRRASISDLRWL